MWPLTNKTRNGTNLAEEAIDIIDQASKVSCMTCHRIGIVSAFVLYGHSMVCVLFHKTTTIKWIGRSMRSIAKQTRSDHPSYMCLCALHGFRSLPQNNKTIYQMNCKSDKIHNKANAITNQNSLDLIMISVLLLPSFSNPRMSYRIVFCILSYRQNAFSRSVFCMLLF